MKLRTMWGHVVDATWHDDLDPDKQITAEEAIAALISDATNTAMAEDTFSDEDCQPLAQRILLMIACELRPDLVQITTTESDQ